MIKHKYGYLFEENSVHKEIKIVYDGGEIGNKDLYSEQFELHENLYSDNNIRFGACESNYIKFRVRREVGKLLGKNLEAFIIIDGVEEIPIRIGKYTVRTDTPSADRLCRDIIAYDAMYTLIHTDLTSWVSKLQFPITGIDLLNSILDYLEIEHTDMQLDIPHGGYPIFGIEADEKSISGQDIVESILEPAACFGNIDRDGIFRVIKFEMIIKKALYPSYNIYPTYGQFLRENQNYSKDGFINIYEYVHEKLYFYIWDKFYLTKEFFTNYNQKQQIWIDVPDFEATQRFCCYLNKEKYVEIGQSKYYSVDFYIIVNGVVTGGYYQANTIVDGKTVTGPLFCYADENSNSLEKISSLPCFDDFESMERWLRYGEVNNCINFTGTFEYQRKLCVSCSYEDFLVDKVGSTSIASHNETLGVVPMGNGKKYRLNNIFVYGDQDKVVMENCLNVMSVFLNKVNAMYGSRPIEAEMVGNPCIELGDSVRINARLGTFDTYVTSRTMTGIQNLRDSLAFNIEENFNEEI